MILSNEKSFVLSGDFSNARAEKKKEGETVPFVQKYKN